MFVFTIPGTVSPSTQSHVDDEYATAAYADPKVCVTTSREPSSRLKQFAKVLNGSRVTWRKRNRCLMACLPPPLPPSILLAGDTIYVSKLPAHQSGQPQDGRGSIRAPVFTSMCRCSVVAASFLLGRVQIIGACKTNGFTDVVIVHETRGEPGACVGRNCFASCCLFVCFIASQLVLLLVSQYLIVPGTPPVCRWLHREPPSPWADCVFFFVKRSAPARH